MHSKEKVDHIKNWILNYVNSMPNTAKSLVIGISGGIDSSIIVALMQKQSIKKINTYSIGFEEKAHDESKFANLVANHIGTNHNEIIINHNDVINALMDSSKYFEKYYSIFQS